LLYGIWYKMKDEDIYYFFRKAQSESKGRGFRLPKDFESHLQNRFTVKNRESLIMVTGFFNTKWENVDPFRYFQCGFELLKTFSYINFFDPRVMRLYIQKDKNIKRELSNCKREITNSVVFVKKYMKNNNIITFNDYTQITNGNRSIIVKHYTQNKVSKFFVVWMIVLGKISLSDNDVAWIPYISDQYREIRVKLDEIGPFLRKIQRKL